MNTLADEFNTGAACSLREAIQAANTNTAFGGCAPGTPGSDTITFALNGTLVVSRAGRDEDANSTGDFDIAESLLIQGNGSSFTIIDAGGLDSLFDTFGAGGSGITISGVTLRNGDSVGGITGLPGAIFIDTNVTVTITASSLLNNRSSASGGAIENRGILSITNSTFSGNSAPGEGGAIRNVGQLSISGSTISGNSADFGGGIFNSTTAVNSALIVNSTISGNSAVTEGGGVSHRTSEGPLSLINVTVAGNTSGSFGGGIFNNSTVNLNIGSTLIGNNSAPNGPDCFASNALDSLNHNLIENTSGCAIVGTTTNNITGSDPNIAALADNGGPTLTHALNPGSPAINAAPATCASPPVNAVDQRGTARPSGAACDIGAFELILDTIPPDTTLTAVPLNPSNNPNPSFSFTGSDNQTPTGSLTYECSRDGAAFTGCTSPQSYTGLADGSHTFLVRAVDGAGNKDATPASFTWVIDTSSPDTTITANPPNPSASANASFSFTGNDGSGSGVAGFQCQLDGGGFSTCTSPQPYVGLANGSHTFQVRAVDAAGNMDGTPASFTWTVDTTAPDTTITANPTNPSASANASFSFTGSDPGGSGVASFACSLDGAAFTGCTSPQTYTGLADGSHTFQVRAVDAAGNMDGTPASFTWTVDTTAPDTTITANPTNPSASANASFSFTGSDPGGTGVASFECSLDGAAFTGCTSPQTYTGLADGSHTFQVRAVDSAGNADGTPASYTWVIDASGPDTTITAFPPNPSASANASFSFTGNDGSGSGVAGFECQLDGGGFSACTSPQTYTGLADGSHTFQVRAVDAVGNRDSTPASYTWTVDTTLPDTTIDSGPPGSSNSTTAAFVFSSNEAGATFECALDGAAFTVCTSPQAYTGLADGSHTFAVRAVDGAGNKDATPASYSWTVDTIAPDTTITANPPNPSASADASFSFTGSDAGGTGVASFECSLDGAAFTGCTSPQPYTGLADGSHTFQVRAVDSAGNRDGTPASFTWTVDATAPDTTITANPTNPTNSTSASFSFTGSDAGGTGVASFECSLDGAAFTGCTSPQPYTGLADGSHTFAVRAVDSTGNKDATPASYSWTVDTAAPDTTISANPPAITNSTSASFSFTGSDAGGTGVASFECSLDGAAFTACTSPQAYTGLADGSHTFAVRAVDAAGNVDGTPASFTWTIDTAALTVTAEQAAAQSDPSLSAPISFTVSFNKPVSDFGDAPGDVSVGGTAPGTLSATITGGPSVYSVTVAGMTGPGTVILSVPAGAATDSAGNLSQASTSTDNSVTFAPTNPIATGLVRLDPDPTAAASVRYRLTFSEEVSGVDAADLLVVPTGISGAAVSGIEGSGTAYIVTVSTGTGDGTLGLNLRDDDSITSLRSAIALGGAGVGNGAITGEIYTIDRTVPTVTLLPLAPVVRGAASFTFTVRYSDALAVRFADLDGADVRVTGPNGFVQLASLVSASPAANAGAIEATYSLTAPGGLWDIRDNGAYTLSLEAGQVRDTAGNAVPAGSLGSFQVRLGTLVFLPMTFAAPPTLPDLVVTRVGVGSGGLEVVITNQGGTPITSAFWVDAYIDPLRAPTQVNEIWQSVGSQGMVWGVTRNALPLEPGESLTLTVGDAYFRADLSSYPAVIPAGTQLYAQVDSASTTTTYGAVLEGHERDGGAYNNITGATVPAGGLRFEPARGPARLGDEELPRRPAR